MLARVEDSRWLEAVLVERLRVSRPEGFEEELPESETEASATGEDLLERWDVGFGSWPGHAPRGKDH